MRPSGISAGYWLIAAVTTDKGAIDISLFDAKNRRRIKVLTKGLDVQIRNIIAQSMSSGRQVGGDLSFSPDGNGPKAGSHP